MKFNVPMPPNGEDQGLSQRLDRLTSWLYMLTERLNAALDNLGEENFSKAAAKRLFEKEEEDK